MTQKRLIDLTLSDLIKFNIWETWIENGIEYVRPSTDIEIFEDSNIGHIVLTDFTLQNKTKFIGFCSPQDPSGLDYLQPVILSDNGHVEFWKDNGWTLEDKQVIFNKLRITDKSLFPIRFETKVKCNNNYYSGTILDFNE